MNIIIPSIAGRAPAQHGWQHTAPGRAGHRARLPQSCSAAALAPVTWLTRDTLSLTSATKVAVRDSLAVQGDPCCLLWKPLNQQQKGMINNCQGNLRGKDVGDKQQGSKYSQCPCFREPGVLRKPHKLENKETGGKKKKKMPTWAYEWVLRAALERGDEVVGEPKKRAPALQFDVQNKASKTSQIRCWGLFLSPRVVMEKDLEGCPPLRNAAHHRVVVGPQLWDAGEEGPNAAPQKSIVSLWCWMGLGCLVTVTLCCRFQLQR